MIYVLGGVVLVIGVSTALYQLRLSRHRGMTRDEFIQQFRDFPVPDAISAAVYDYYRSSAISRKFGVSPEDRFADLFSDEDEDIEFDAEELTKKLEMEVEVRPNLEKWGKPFVTVRDMVLWLDWVRRSAHVDGAPR